MQKAEDLTALSDDRRVKRQPLPGVLGEIERVCGYGVAEKFALTFGGQEIYIPLSLNETHPIARAVGLTNAQAADIGAVAGRSGSGSGGSWCVPLAETELKWNIARRLRLQGMSRNEIVSAMRKRYHFPLTAGHVGVLTRGLRVDKPTGRPAAPAVNHAVNMATRAGR